MVSFGIDSFVASKQFQDKVGSNGLALASSASTIYGICHSKLFSTEHEHLCRYYDCDKVQGKNFDRLFDW